MLNVKPNLRMSCKVLKYTFHLICLCATAGMLCWCFYRYSRNDDVSLVLLRTFNHKESDIAPSVSMCFVNPFLNGKLNTYGSGINSTSYSLFLQGHLFDERMHHIKYDDVTFALNDFLVGVKIFSADKKIYWYDHLGKNKTFGWIPDYYIGYRSPFSKCFSFDTPYIEKSKIASMGIAMKTSIFFNRTRPHKPEYNVQISNWSGLFVLFHYPGQLHRSTSTEKSNWPLRKSNNGSYDMRFTLKGMEVSEQRNKANKPCNKNWKFDDVSIIDDVILQTGCRLPYWKTCLLYTSPSPRDATLSRMPSSA